VIIDTHAHFFPRAVLDFYRQAGSDRVEVVDNDRGTMTVLFDGKVFHPSLPLAIYDLTAHIDSMNAVAVDVHALSVPPPMVYWAAPAQGLELSQIANNALSELADERPGRILPVASVPLQAPELAIEELRRVVTELDHKMVVVGSNIDGIELDDPSLEPFWAEAEQLGIAVFVHPILGPVTGQLPMDYYRLNLSLGMVTDTTIAVSRIICSGFIDRYPDLRISFAHLGGLLPFVGDRIDYFLRHQPGARIHANGNFNDYVGRFWYDVVCYSDRMLQSALSWVGSDRLMLGTDSPFMGDSTQDIKTVIDESPFLTAEERLAVYEGNARRFLRLGDSSVDIDKNGSDARQQGATTG
jgi:aminocarboxymuconate-semialdehyde decarboxylase